MPNWSIFSLIQFFFWSSRNFCRTDPVGILLAYLIASKPVIFPRFMIILSVGVIAWQLFSIFYVSSKRLIAFLSFSFYIIDSSLTSSLVCSSSGPCEGRECYEGLDGNDSYVSRQLFLSSFQPMILFLNLSESFKVAYALSVFCG